MEKQNVLLKTLYSNPAFGSDVGIITAHCPKHGPYRGFARLNPNGTRYVSRCPECQRLEEIENQERNRVKIGESQIIASRMQAAGVPEEYCSLTFETLPKGLLVNGDVITACTQLCEGEINNLLLLGTNGVGKTSLACASLSRILTTKQTENFPTIFYTKEAKLLRAMKSTFGRREGPTEQDIINEMGRYDVLVIDEIGKTASTDYNASAIEEIVDMRHKTRRTIVCGNISVEDLATHFTDGTRSKLSYKSRMKDIRDIDHRRNCNA
jgi:DNA replication protein DnaC